MSATHDWHGEEILKLRAELRRHRYVTPSPETGAINQLQLRIDSDAATLSQLQRRRDVVAGERRWAEAAINGYQRALALVTASHDLVPSELAGGRFRQRRDEQQTTADELAVELRALERTITETKDAIVAAQVEIVGLMRRTLAVADRRAAEVERARRRRMEAARQSLQGAPMWSPTAVLGYRVWTLTGNVLNGAWRPWTSPHMVAICAGGPGSPHTDGRCAAVAFGCGIYAAKSPQPLLRAVGMRNGVNYAVGLVGLEGTVVEHERGYRAARATVLALALVSGAPVRFIADPAELATVFADPGARLRAGGIERYAPDHRPTTQAITDYLERQARRNQSWTSANPSE